MTKTLDLAGAPLNASLVVASDVHLREADDDRSKLLLDVLSRLGPGVECLVLNGDIFDFCLGDSRYFQNKFRAIGVALADVAARGIRVVFVEGNHEFHMESVGWPGVEIIQTFDLTITVKSGESFRITHGDLLTRDPLYRAFRGLVKSRLARFCASFIPGSWLDAYALKHAKVSRAQDKYRRLDHQRILGAFSRWLSSVDADHGIIGHFHIPYAEKQARSDGLMLSVESWDRPNLLVFADHRFHRIHLSAVGAPFVPEPATPFL